MASSGWQLTSFPVAPPPYFRPGPNNYQVQSDKLQLCDRIIVIVRGSPARLGGKYREGESKNVVCAVSIYSIPSMVNTLRGLQVLHERLNMKYIAVGVMNGSKKTSYTHYHPHSNLSRLPLDRPLLQPLPRQSAFCAITTITITDFRLFKIIHNLMFSLCFI